MKILKHTLFYAALPLFSACAGVTYSNSYENSASEEKARGVRYYEKAPFLLVYSDGKGGLTQEVVWIADTTVIKSADPFAYFSKNKTALKFDRGMFSEVETSIDTTVVPKAALEALQTIATAAISAADGSDRGSPKDVAFPMISLFRIVGDGDEVRFVGHVGQGDIKLTYVPKAVTPETKAGK